MAIKKVYTDIKYGFERNSAGDISPVYDENSINQSLMTLFMTQKGERFFNLSYGTNIKRLLFEPLDQKTAKDIVTEITDSIQYWEGKRVDIQSITIDIDYDKSQYIIKVTYQIKSTTQLGELTTTLFKQ